MTLDLDWIDGRIGEAWSGEVPDGSHINVVLARRGSATAASATTALACPTPGHAPVVVGPGAGNVGAAGSRLMAEQGHGAARFARAADLGRCPAGDRPRA